MTEKNIMTEDDGDEDIIAIEVDEKGEIIAPPADTKPQADEHGDEDEGDEEGDERLGDDHSEDEEGSTAERNRKRREQRKARRERARELTNEELRTLRETNNMLAQRLAQLEQHAVGVNVNSLQQRKQAIEQQIAMADDVRAQALSAGNGDDVIKAERIRDSLRAEASQLDQQIGQFEYARQQAAQPRPDPRVASYAQQWTAANPWYDPRGGDADSRTAKEIDNQLVKEGYDPASQSYWAELTARCKDAFEGADSGTSKPSKKGPPIGTSREHTPPSTRSNEIRVTPERKQAMIDAGAWDDPVRRNRMLKAYRDYDNQSKAN